MITKVQMSAPRQRLREYPHQLSGGMRQRAMIALALSCNPSILTVGLLNSVPVLGRSGRQVLVPIKGMVPTPTEIIPGCPFAPRCPAAMSVCRERLPVLQEIRPGHLAACWLYGQKEQAQPKEVAVEQ
jgi:oligopeptide/dipeptide ABC transporter ATP-binding protein